MSLNKNVFYTLLTQLPTTAFGFLTGVFITRLLGPEGRGIYTLFQANIELFTLIFGLSTSSAIVYFVASRKIDLEKLIGIGIASLSVSTVLLVAVLAALVLSPHSSLVLPSDCDSLFFIAYLVIGYVVGLANAYISAVFQGKSQFTVVNKVAIGNSCLNLLLFGVLFVYSVSNEQPIGVRTVLSVSMLVFALNLVLWLYFYWTRIGVRPSFNFSFREHVLPLVSFGLLLHLIYAINFLNYRLDVWIVNYYGGSEQLGFYSLAVNVAQMLWLISAPISTVLAPHLTDADGWENKSKQFGFYSRLNCTGALAAVLVAFCCVDQVLPAVYGSAFVASVRPFKLLMVGIFFGALTKVFAVYVVAKNQLRFNLIAVSLGLAVTVVLDLALIPKFGIIGASMATSAAYAAILGCVLYAVFCKLGLPFGNYFLLTPEDMRTVSRKFRIALGAS